jgi:IclR family acetate operon transcriptional repressor
VLQLARTMQGEAALLAAAEPEVDALSRATGEHINLAVLRDRQTWVLLARDGTGEVVARPRTRGVPPPGPAGPPGAGERRGPGEPGGSAGIGEPHFHTTGRGRLFLAFLPPEEARAIVAATGLPAVGPRTITDEGRLWEEVALARRRRYATARGERSAHLAGIAFAVTDGRDALVATLGITVPVFTLDERREAELMALGLAAARRVERRLRGESP